MTPQEAQKIKQERQEYEKQGVIHNLEMHKMILETWKRDSPKMTARLNKLKVTDELAYVSQERMWQTMTQYQKAKMPPTDAREQAEKEHLMLEPESQEPMENQDEWEY